MDATIHSSKQPPLCIGILTTPDPKRKFSGNRENFIDLIRTGYEHGALVYVVTTADIKLGSKQVQAFCYQFPSKKWRKQLMPFPDVIYNRIPTRRLEIQSDVQRTLQACIRSKSLNVFNPYFFDKWTLFEWLDQSSTTRKYVPTTKQLHGKSSLEVMLNRFDCVYLKPIEGKAGKGIMRLEQIPVKNSQPVLKLTMQEKMNSHYEQFSDLSDAWNRIDGLTSGEEYIIQQGISLASYNKRPFDLRALLQKTAEGKWSVTGIGARVAGKRSITTHVPRGGSIDDPARLLAKSFGSLKAKRILRHSRKTALLLAHNLEKTSKQTLGEMSMDLGIDTNGRTWFFEANSKPMKFDEPHIRNKSLERIISYSQYLAKKSK
ncbi:YheC/YheD family protein [Paenibacillus lutrae]|uniref:YheC/YheD family protein n=1 Tax=Paenibacillus lutrae TaxID=2078573 RepID=A0A7X3FJG6_9BACL|nr:YheC/YheD family protein [Paenibacillus lutrae]